MRSVESVGSGRSLEMRGLSNVKGRHGASAKRARHLLALSVAGVVGLVSSSIARAATYTWANPSTSDNSWIPTSPDTNWTTAGALTTTYPGSTGTSGNTDVATFYAGSGASNNINLSSNLYIGQISFTGSSTIGNPGSGVQAPADPFTISTSNNSALIINNAGTILLSSSPVASSSVTETISAPITLGATSGTAYLTNNAGYFTGEPINVLSITGNISTGNGNTLLLNAPNDNTLAASNVDFKISGNISSNGALTLPSSNNNASTAVLSGSNTYSGATTIRAGTLVLFTGGSLGNTAIAVTPFATGNVGTFEAYGGTTIGSAVSGKASLNASIVSTFKAPSLTFTDQGTPSPINLYGGSTGGVPAVLTLNTATLNFSVGGATTAADELIVNGGTGAAVSPGNLINIVASPGTTSLTPGNYTLIADSAGGLTSGDFALSTTSLTVNGSTYPLSLVSDPTGDTVELNIAPSPEPASLGILALGGLGLMRRRRHVAKA